MKFNLEDFQQDGICGKILRGLIVLYVAKDYWIAAKGYSLYKYDVVSQEWNLFGKLQDNKYSMTSRFRLTRRILRAEIRYLLHLSNGEWICTAKKGLFKASAGGGDFVKCCCIEKGSRPMVLCQGIDGIVYWGDYCFNPERREIQIHKSNDYGRTWEIAYTFKTGEINHIHGIFSDPFIKGRIWVTTGDDDDACIFGYTDDNFKTFEKKYEGSQLYRVCVPLFLKDSIIYSTDSQFVQNEIRRIDRKSEAVSKIRKIEGSGIYSVQTHQWMAVSTTIEPSDVNIDKYSHLWFSRIGVQWKHVVKFKKDVWNKTLFQFGSIRFPYYEDMESDLLVFNGRALNSIDQSTLIVSLIDNNL